VQCRRRDRARGPAVFDGGPVRPLHMNTLCTISEWPFRVAAAPVVRAPTHEKLLRAWAVESCSE